MSPAPSKDIGGSSIQITTKGATISQVFVNDAPFVMFNAL